MYTNNKPVQAFWQFTYSQAFTVLHEVHFVFKIWTGIILNRLS